MREIKSINAQQWLSLINSEADPNIDRYDVSYVEFGGQYSVVIETGYGVFRSNQTKNQNDLPELEEETKQRYNSAKTAGLIFNPKIGTSLVK